MRRFLLALLALVWCSQAFAQSFPKPQDVPTPTFVAPVLDTTGGFNYPIDSTVTPMPVTPLTNIPIPSTTNRIVTDGPYDGTLQVPFCTTLPYGGLSACNENKFRTLVDDCHILPDDPIRNYLQFGLSHLHQFFGNCSTNAGSTYSSLRKHALNSTAAGTDTNGTGYWRPAIVVLNPYGDGKNYALHANYNTVYYDENPAGNGTGYGLKAPIPVGLRYVFGFDMDATWNGTAPVQFAWLQSYVDAANATIGHNRYSLTNAGHYNSEAKYNCSGATSVNTHGNFDYVLKNPDGSDPFGGTCEGAAFTGSISGTTMTVSAVASGTIKLGNNLSGLGVANGGDQLTVKTQVSGTTGGVGTYTISKSVTVSSETLHTFPEFYVSFNGNSCYDGTNLWSPGGYKHVIPAIWDVDRAHWVCPKNYYGIPVLEEEIHFTHYGWTDRQRWDLSSDIAFRAKYGLTQSQLPPGKTMHGDWMFGWDNVQMLKWEQSCLGVEHHTGHLCQNSQISSTEYLKGGFVGEAGAGGRTPQVDLTNLEHSVSSDPGWEPIPSAWSGMLTNMHIHH